MKKILVLMSTYNGSRYISEQIKSILNQNTENQIDILIRDDGSNDDTREKILEIKKGIDSKIFLIYGENKGVNESYFELMKIAEGYDYYAFSDQDDIWMKDKISEGVEKIENMEKNYSGPILYGGCSYITDINLNIIGETTKLKKEITLKNTIIQNFLPGHSQVFNNELLILLKKDIKIEDIYVYDAWVTNVAMLYGKILFDNNPHTYYRQHGSNVTGYVGESNCLYWMKERIRRIKNSESNKMGKQIMLFFELYKADLNVEDRNEIEEFIDSQHTILKRIFFAKKTTLYRQSNFQTILFKILYIFGGYKI